MSSDQLNKEIYNKINSNKNLEDDDDDNDDDDGNNSDNHDDGQLDKKLQRLLKCVGIQQIRDSTARCIMKYLTQIEPIDLTKGNGIYFEQVIFGRDAKILQILLDYQEEYMKKMDIKDQYTLPKARYKLRKILNVAVSRFGSDEQMDIVLEKYIPQESDYDSDEQFEDIKPSFKKKNLYKLKSYQD